jgi:hypothetical protein
MVEVVVPGAADQVMVEPLVLGQQAKEIMGVPAPVPVLMPQVVVEAQVQ